MDKKGGVPWVIVGLIIIILSAVLLVSVIGVYGFAVTKSVDRTVCMMSVVFRYSSGGLFGGLWDTGKLKCNTEEVEIEDPDVGEVMGTVADQMRWCWWKMGEGKIDYLSSIYFGEKNAACVVCSIINSEGEVKFDAKDFSEFLNENSYKFGTKKTYTSYFLGADFSELDFGEGEIVLSKQNPLFVTFMAGKIVESWPDQIIKAGVFGGAVATVTTVGGAAVGGLFGSIIPVAGTGAGIVKGGLIGLKTGLFLGGVTTGVTAAGHRTTFQSTLLVSSGEELIERCDRLE